ncbi:MAG: tyrosine-type recombinase/integrase [Pseudolabrys sp.]
MSIRKRVWTTAKGEKKEAWIVDYVDQDGARHIETFARRRDADDYRATVKVDVRTGVHTAPSKSLTVAEAAADWLTFVKLERRERSTLTAYRQQVELHINPRIGREKLAKLTTPLINNFRDDLLTHMSRAMAAKVLTCLKMVLKDAKRRGNVAQNVALDVSISPDKRGKVKLKVGIDIPTPDEIKHIVQAATGKQRPFLLTAIFTGLRASELRGLRWIDVDLKAGELHVRQRADRYGVIGKLKSESGERTVPLGPLVVNALRQWKLACPKGDLGLVFPNGSGRIEDHANIVQRVLWPALEAAGVIDAKGKAKYTGLHALRHFYASWCINRRADGGLELPIKTVQARLGHASIVMTSDRYGHLFPRGDDGGELADAERTLLA